MAINKHTTSIFIDTGFGHMLGNADIITVVFTSIATEFGVESSARDAFNIGFHSVVVVLGILYMVFSPSPFSFLAVVYCQAFLRFALGSNPCSLAFQRIQRFAGFAGR